VFCGVDFMAESASILNPDKIVLLPVKEAGCPMADMVTVERLREKKKQHPNAAICCYVNSSAEIKAEMVSKQLKNISAKGTFTIK